MGVAILVGGGTGVGSGIEEIEGLGSDMTDESIKMCKKWVLKIGSCCICGSRNENVETRMRGERSE